MEIVNFGDKNIKNKPMAIALGFFDSLHKGHGKIISGLISYAQDNGISPAVMTFDNNPFEILHKDIKLVYTFSERCELLKKMGADIVIAAHFDEKFMNVQPQDFLKTLKSSYNIKYIGCGFDYSFGIGGTGGVKLLSDFCAPNNIVLNVSNEFKINGEKVSSGMVRKLISEGEIEQANTLLSAPYCVFGRVTDGRHVGSRLTYPTANIIPASDKELILPGVYATNTYIGGQKYMSVTNAGSKPTFREYSYGYETHILDYNQGVKCKRPPEGGHLIFDDADFKSSDSLIYNSDLYGQYIKVEFLKRLRNVAEFKNAESLKAAITADIDARRKLG